jgi:hypothetical protein
MTDLTIHNENSDVFRDNIKERRDLYYVSYQPADSRYQFSFLYLTYPDSIPDRKVIKEQMISEMLEWLNRFPVPVMVSAFNAADDCLDVHDEPRKSDLVGYIDRATSKIVQRWGTLNDAEFPKEQSSPQYLSAAYPTVPFRLKEAVRRGADRNAIQLRRGLRLFRIAAVFLVAIPLAVNILSLGINWIGYALWSISVSVGLFKFAKALGWIKPSARQLAKDEEMRKMKHYYYHCEQNPIGFGRLRAENFERDAVQKTRQEFESLSSTARAAS